MAFVHLQVHSEYSMLRSPVRIKALLKRAKELGQEAIALTDHGNLFGLLDFYINAKGMGLKPILGMHVYLEQPDAPAPIPTQNDNWMQRAILIAKDNQGYRNLVKLASFRYEHPEDWRDVPSVPMSLLSSHNEGLLCITGDYASRLGQDILEGNESEARQFLEYLQAIFPERLWLSLQNQGLQGQEQLTAGLRKLSGTFGIPLVATNNVHYLKREDSVTHRVQLCIAARETLNRFESREFASDQFYLRTEEEMRALFPEDAKAIEESVRIAEMCSVSIDTKVPDDRYWPRFQIPEEFQDSNDYLAYLVKERLPRRYDQADAPYWKRACERADSELAMIKQMKVAGYLLIVWDFINWSRENGIPVGPGRGSAAGSLVAFVIGITDIDPLRFDLLFERFLNPERVSMPDIDTDFSDTDRDRVIEYVIQKYGIECVSQIVTYGRLKAKAVIRDVARVLGLPPRGEVDRIAKLIPGKLPDPIGMNVGLKDAWEAVPELREFVEADDRLKELWKLSLQLEGTLRQPGVHAAAVIIAPEPISNLAPLFRANPGDRAVIQYDKTYAEGIGLLKMDFLGLRNLSVIQDALAMIQEYRGIRIDMQKLELEDSATFELLGKGLTVGVFQFESGGMQEWLRKLKPSKIEDLIAMNALYRPGPMEQIPRYISCKHGHDPIDCYHKDLEIVLGETNGVMVYQEQVMRIAQILAGFTLGGADNLRRVMAKKDKEKMDKLHPKFVGGAVERGYAKELAEKIWEDMVPFANYAFNKSHSAAYSYVAYQTAYLKANYGPEFMAANMTSEIGNTDNLVKLILECRKMGLTIEHPNVNSSMATFTARSGKVQYGLAGIRNVGLSVIEDMVEERQENGPFQTLFDLCKRVVARQATKDDEEAKKNKGTGPDHRRPPLNKRILESLVMAGALDHLPGSRAEQHASIDKALEIANNARKDRDSGQISLFGGDEQDGGIPLGEELERVDAWTYMELLNKEKEVLGLYLSGHPLEEYRADLRGFTSIPLTESALFSVALGENVLLGGMVTQMKSFQSKQDGKVFGVATIEDFDGTIEIFFKPETFEKVRDHLAADSMILVRGRLDKSRDGNNRQLIAEKVIPLEEARARLARFVHMEFSSAGLTEITLRSIQELAESWQPLEDTQGCHMVFHVSTASGLEYTLGGRQHRVSPEPGFLNAIGDLVGSEHVWVSHKDR